MNNEFQHLVTSYCYEYVLLVGFGDEETWQQHEFVHTWYEANGDHEIPKGPNQGSGSPLCPPEMQGMQKMCTRYLLCEYSTFSTINSTFPGAVVWYEKIYFEVLYFYYNLVWNVYVDVRTMKYLWLWYSHYFIGNFVVFHIIYERQRNSYTTRWTIAILGTFFWLMILGGLERLRRRSRFIYRCSYPTNRPSLLLSIEGTSKRMPYVPGVYISLSDTVWHMTYKMYIHLWFWYAFLSLDEMSTSRRKNEEYYSISSRWRERCLACRLARHARNSTIMGQTQK